MNASDLLPSPVNKIIDGLRDVQIALRVLEDLPIPTIRQVEAGDSSLERFVTYGEAKKDRQKVIRLADAMTMLFALHDAIVKAHILQLDDIIANAADSLLKNFPIGGGVVKPKHVIDFAEILFSGHIKAGLKLAAENWERELRAIENGDTWFFIAQAVAESVALLTSAEVLKRLGADVRARIEIVAAVRKLNATLPQPFVTRLVREKPTKMKKH